MTQYPDQDYYDPIPKALKFQNTAMDTYTVEERMRE